MKHAVLCLILMCSVVNAGPIGRQWAQENGISDEEKHWFSNQYVPGGPAKGALCCSIADGTYAEEDIRNGHYWARFMYKKWDIPSQQMVDADSGWMPVPDEVILSTNHHGAPVVWWQMVGATLTIRCYAIGAGI